MINYLFIENFKGLQKLEMNNITPITLVSGRNNVGKTSLLEAIFFFYDHVSADVFAKLSSMRSGYVEPAARLWEYLFCRMDTDKGMNFIIGAGERKKSLIIRKDVDFVPSVGAVPNPEIMGQLLTAVKSSYSLKFEYKDDDYKETGHFSSNQAGVLVNVETSLDKNERRPMKWVLMIDSSSGKVTQELVDWIGNLEIQEKKESAVRLLRLIDPDVKDIFSASQNGLVQLYVKTKREIVPLKYSGDGMVRLLYMMAAILSNPDSLILIDEIENGFHYTMYEKLWSALSEVSKESNCQIIATTHSYENIAAAVSGTKQVGRDDDFSIHRLEKRDEIIVDNYYDHDLAALALESNMEVR